MIRSARAARANQELCPAPFGARALAFSIVFRRVFKVAIADSQINAAL